MWICLKPKILPKGYAAKTEKLKLKYRDQNCKFKWFNAMKHCGENYKYSIWKSEYPLVIEKKKNTAIFVLQKIWSL